MKDKRSLILLIFLATFYIIGKLKLTNQKELISCQNLTT